MTNPIYCEVWQSPSHHRCTPNPGVATSAFSTASTGQIAGRTASAASRGQQAVPPPALPSLQNFSIENSKVLVYISHVRYIQRRLATVLVDAGRHFPAVVVTGPRRAGKTTLLRKLFAKAQYVLLEDPDVQARVRNDPRAFLEALRPPVVFDEIQNTPELLAYVRTIIVNGYQLIGRSFFTGCLEFPIRYLG